MKKPKRLSRRRIKAKNWRMMEWFPATMRPLFRRITFSAENIKHKLAMIEWKKGANR